MNDFKALRFERADGVATITFDNPGNRNAFDMVLRDELAAVLDEVRRDAATRALVVTGANGLRR
jgi:2-(1,2-epoxy-1,2-dihydrophenyl)acetyl-CoA isomerase